MSNVVKNTLIIDVDTERENAIIFTKPAAIPKPSNAQEAAKMIITDISCLAEAITTLIHVASENKYADKNELVNATIKTIYEVLIPSDNNVTETNLDEH